MTYSRRPKLRRRLSEAQARDVQHLAKASQVILAENVDHKALIAKLQSIWEAGDVESGVGEDGTIMKRRIAVLVAVVKEDEDFPDVRTLIADMPEPARSKLIQ